MRNKNRQDAQMRRARNRRGIVDLQTLAQRARDDEDAVIEQAVYEALKAGDLALAAARTGTIRSARYRQLAEAAMVRARAEMEPPVHPVAKRMRARKVAEIADAYGATEATKAAVKIKRTRKKKAPEVST
jgi:hypothetical protein